jgi:hypothetical protein
LGFSHLFLHINWRFEFFFGFKILAAFLIFVLRYLRGWAILHGRGVGIALGDGG